MIETVNAVFDKMVLAKLDVMRKLQVIGWMIQAV